MLDIMSVQVTQGQKLTADATVRLQNMEEKIQQLQGLVEESTHNKSEQSQTLEARLKAQEELIKTLTNNLNDQTSKLNLVETRLSEQDKFIKEILSTLKSQNQPVENKKKISPYELAMQEYSKGKYKEVKPQLETLLNDKSIKGAQKARVIHNLGMIAFIQNNSQDSMTYFAKLYSEYPASTYNANGLIHLAKTFIKLNQKDQAKQTLEEMIKKFPTHKKASTAKEMLKSL